MTGSENGTGDLQTFKRIPSELLKDKGRNWPDFFIGERIMVKGVIFQIVGQKSGGLVIKPYVKRITDPVEQRRIVSDMIPKR